MNLQFNYNELNITNVIMINNYKNILLRARESSNVLIHSDEDLVNFIKTYLQKITLQLADGTQKNISLDDKFDSDIIRLKFLDILSYAFNLNLSISTNLIIQKFENNDLNTVLDFIEIVFNTLKYYLLADWKSVLAERNPEIKIMLVEAEKSSLNETCIH